MFRGWVFLAASLLMMTAPAAAQTTSAPAGEPPLRRWLEIQALTAYTRYRFIETSADVVTSNLLQYKETVRARVNLDARRRYTINFGLFSGSTFISGWDATGIGTGPADFHSHYLKQFFGSASPVNGIEFQYGGLYVARGEATEFTTYDDDGYVVGERVSVRRPKQVFLDEIIVTRGDVGPLATPNVVKRWGGLKHPHYTQVEGTKRFAPWISGTLDFSTQAGADVVRAAVSLRLKAPSPVSAVRYEQYHRVSSHPASGFAVTVDRAVTKWVRLQAGYATIDERYGGLNADRIQRGRRVFAIAAVPLVGPLSASFFATQAFHSPYAISNRTRFDAILQYDVLSSLRKTGIF